MQRREHRTDVKKQLAAEGIREAPPTWLTNKDMMPEMEAVEESSTAARPTSPPHSCVIRSGSACSAAQLVLMDRKMEP